MTNQRVNELIEEIHILAYHNERLDSSAPNYERKLAENIASLDVLEAELTAALLKMEREGHKTKMRTHFRLIQGGKK